MNLEDLTDVHTGRHTQRVQHDVKRAAIRKERHILYRKYTGNDTLVTVTTCHLITDGDLSLLCNVNADCLIHARRQLVAVLSCEYLCIHDDTVLAVRHLQGSVTHFSCLLAEDCAEQPLLGCQLSLSLRSYLSD